MTQKDAPKHWVKACLHQKKKSGSICIWCGWEDMLLWKILQNKATVYKKLTHNSGCLKLFGWKNMYGMAKPYSSRQQQDPYRDLLAFAVYPNFVVTIFFFFSPCDHHMVTLGLAPINFCFSCSSLKAKSNITFDSKELLIIVIYDFFDTTPNDVCARKSSTNWCRGGKMLTVAIIDCLFQYKSVLLLLFPQPNIFLFVEIDNLSSLVVQLFNRSLFLFSIVCLFS